MNDFLKVVKVFSKAVNFWVYQQSLNDQKAKAEIERQVDEYKATQKKLAAAMEEAKSRSTALNKRIEVLSRTNSEQKRELADLHTRYCELVRQKRKLEELYSTLKESGSVGVGSNGSGGGGEPVKRRRNKSKGDGDSDDDDDDNNNNNKGPSPPQVRPGKNLFSSHEELVLQSPQTPKMRPLSFSGSNGVSFSPRKPGSFSIFESTSSSSSSSPQRQTRFSLEKLRQVNTRQATSKGTSSPPLPPLTRDRFNAFKKKDGRPSSSSPSSPKIIPFNKI